MLADTAQALHVQQHGTQGIESIISAVQIADIIKRFESKGYKLVAIKMIVSPQYARYAQPSSHTLTAISRLGMYTCTCARVLHVLTCVTLTHAISSGPLQCARVKSLRGAPGQTLLQQASHIPDIWTRCSYGELYIVTTHTRTHSPQTHLSDSERCT